MADQRQISKAVIARLPRYYRYLGELMEEGIERISSNELSARMKVTASQIRQDLNNFGGFGQQGYGYNVKYLYTEIARILGIDRQHNLIIIGAGNLGQAIANYTNFEKRGFMIKGMFDINPRLIGLVVRGVEIRGIDDLEQFIVENEVQIAALTIPKTKAPEIADRLVKAGIKAIWNFAHTDLNVPDDVVVENTKQALEKGFTAMKLKVGSADPERDIRRAELIRKTAGSAATIMVDANQQWTLQKAMYVIDRLKAIDPFWVEEPTDPDDVLAHQTLRRAFHPIRIALGEHVPNKVIFKNYLQAGAMDINQVDAVRVGASLNSSSSA